MRPRSTGYVYPFPSSTPGRVDQGKDFTGKGSILAIGKAQILATHPPPGWPEGGGILYRLLEGPRAGTIIYTYEGVDVHPGIHPGQIVQAGTPIASFRPGGSIETGFADASGETLAHDRGEQAPGNSNLRAGKEMTRFLASLTGSSISLPHSTLSPGSSKKYSGIPGVEQVEEGVSAGESAADAVANLPAHLVGMFTEHAEALMLNIGLIGGGAFLVYYGAALMMGVKKPVGTPVKAATEAAVMAPK